ncbi:hypothetical protein [Sorangium sp. So ce426]|uniref:hypothetical protein n=1 Tax=unclassified Sorangium TaxID=2621164 RepID=UPI003F5AE88B
MPSLLGKAVDVITLNDAGDVLRGVDIAIEGGSIVAVGEAPPGFLADEVLDGTDLIALPGFWNAHTRPRTSLVGNIVYSARSSDIRHSIIAGRLVMKDHELLTLDEERILWEAERRAFAMLGRAQGTALREYRG